MRLNYVIAAWGGYRRSDDERAIADRTFFLRTHLATLARVRNQLDAITIVVPDCPDEPAAFTDYLAALPYLVIRRPNAGFSYGSFTEAHRQTRDSFDGFIFVEDDYVFVEDDFDGKLVDLAASRGAALVCGAVLPCGDVPALPGVALGLCTTPALDHWAASSKLACDSVDVGYTAAEAWQVRWGVDFAKLSLPMVDWLDQWATPYWTHTGTVRWYGSLEHRPMVMPIQMFDRTADRVDPDGILIDRFSGPRIEDGSRA